MFRISSESISFKFKTLSVNVFGFLRIHQGSSEKVYFLQRGGVFSLDPAFNG